MLKIGRIHNIFHPMAISSAFLSDNETKVDLLNAEAIAATIVKVLLDQPDKPITVGVHGDWGAGKSSVIEMIEANLQKQDGVLCLKVNGWRFQGFEDAKIALIESIVTGLLDQRPLLTKADDAVKDVLKRVDWLKVAKHLGSLALTAYTGVPSADQLRLGIAALEKFAGDPAQVFSKENVQAAVEAMKTSITLKPGEDSKQIPAEIQEFRKAFDKLLAAAKVKQLVVLVDDLDRCLPDTAIETLEAIRLFVFTSKTAFVIAADEAMIEYAVRKHFPELPDGSGPQTYARNYLEKLIQVPFRIPALGETETRTYATLLFIGSVLGEGDAEFNKLITAAREKLKRPWTNTLIDTAAIKAALGEKASMAQDALTLSDQIGPILASGTKGNPRQIKRFINTLLLRQRTADARGFGGDVTLPALAKLLLAERFFPQLFDQLASIAAIAHDGKCPDLAYLENAAKSPAHGGVLGKQATPKSALLEQTEGASSKAIEAGVLAEWASYPGVVAWAKIDPVLSTVDLRPYLFIAKDRRDYFSGASLLGPLAPLAEKLFGPKLAVQALDAEVRRLNATDAAQVFEAVRSRIMANGSFDTQPSGIDGLMMLVKAHPALQSGLVDFLENLPRQKLGPWVVRGWDGVITEAATLERFKRLLHAWSTAANNAALKTAAGGVAAVSRGKVNR